MAGKNIFYQNPLLRLAIPLMLGIAMGWMCNIGLLHILSVFVISVLLLIYGFVRPAVRWMFGVGAMMFMFSAGLFVEHEQALDKAPQWSGKKGRYEAHLVEMPAVRGTNVKVLAELISTGDAVASNERLQGPVYLYFSRTEESERLSAGDVISLETTISSPKNQGNPAEFDIENFYYIKGISGTAFVPEKKWNLQPYKKNSLQTYALKLRAKAITLYERLGFEKESLALLSALTLGEKRDFPQELKEDYSVAGASHILALSGLHLGILYMLLTLIIPLRGDKVVCRILRELAVIIVLWGFAFVAGLSPSVVRSATLFTLMSLARLFGYEVSQLSSLSFAAIVMLLFSPHLLFDVSFQLSFVAVFAILLLAPPLQKIMGVYNHGALYRYVANLFILSFVSQIGTMPLVWYHFGVFPVYFLITNVFVVPLAFVVMLLVVILWVLTPVPLLQHGVAWLLCLVIDLMNMGVRCVAELPGASFQLPPLNFVDAVCVAVLIVLFALSLYRHRQRLLIFALFATLAFAVYMFIAKTPDKYDYMVVYNNRKNPLLHIVFEGGENYLVSTVPQLDAEYEYVSKPFLQRESLPTPQWIYWEYNDTLVQYNEELFDFNGVTVKLLDNAYWHENECMTPVDILILCRGFLGRISELVKVYPAECVVVDGSLYKRSREKIKREYFQLGIDVVDISQTGAMKVVVDDDNFDLVMLKGK